jgi:replicative DNA helicase
VTDQTLQSTLPSSPESEAALLGACFLNPGIITQTKELLTPSDFYLESHAAIFHAVVQLGKQTEPATVAAYLSQHGQLEQAGGRTMIANLAESMSTSAGWRYHADIILDRSNRRKLVVACEVAKDHANDLTTEYNQTISEHKASIRELEPEDRTDRETNEALCKEIFKDIERREASKTPYTGIKTGFENLDTRAWGLEPGTTTYLIARPSMGKTALSLNIAEYVSKHEPGLVLFFSLESSSKALMRRLVAAHSTVYLTRIRKAELDDSQWPFLMEAFNELSANQNLRIISHPRFKQVERLLSKAETLAIQRPLSLIVIDHIQRMSTGARKQNRHLELSYISELLTSLSQTLNIPMIVLSQLKRGVESRKDPRPELSDMRESGDLEQNADQVWSIYRKDKEAELAEIECLKGRDTGTWKTCLRFDRNIQRFYDTTDQPEPDDNGRVHWQDKE